VFPWAGNSLTADIQAGCKVLPTQAEQLKRRFGSASPNDFNLNEVVAVPGLSNRKPKDVLLKNVAVIMEDRLREIAALVQVEIMKSGYDGKLLGGIVLTGGTAMTPGIEHVFSRVTGIEEVRVGYPEHLEPNGRADLVGEPAFATAVGLVWAGYKTIDHRIPFISDPSRAVQTSEESMPSRPATNNYTPPTPPAREKEKTEKPVGSEPEETGLLGWLRKWTRPIRGSEIEPY
jgi:cell division protein FtsA